MLTYKHGLTALLLLAIPGIALGQQRLTQQGNNQHQHGHLQHGHHHHGLGVGFVWGYPNYVWGYPNYYFGYDPSYYSFSNFVPGFTYSSPNFIAPLSTSSVTLPSTTKTRPVNTALQPNQARLEVILPDAEAELQVDRRTMSSLGAVRQFDTPDLDPNKLYSYTLVAKWNDSGHSRRDARKIEVRAGSRYVVDFTRPAEVEALSASGSVRSPW